MAKSKKAALTVSPSALLNSHAADIAVVTEGEPATTLEALAEQAATAVGRLEDAGLDAEDLSCAVMYLRGAHDSEGADRQVLLKKADEHMEAADEVVNDYRLML